MLIIFLASSAPSTSLPNYGTWDTLVKKGGHMLGYALLANSFWFGFGFRKDKIWQAWLFAVIYAMTDEFHQIFTPGRHSSLVDVFLFDGGGAALGLTASAAFFWSMAKFNRKKIQNT